MAHPAIDGPADRAWRDLWLSSAFTRGIGRHREPLVRARSRCVIRLGSLPCFNRTRCCRRDRGQDATPGDDSRHPLSPTRSHHPGHPGRDAGQPRARRLGRRRRRRLAGARRDALDPRCPVPRHGGVVPDSRQGRRRAEGRRRRRCVHRHRHRLLPGRDRRQDPDRDRGALGALQRSGRRHGRHDVRHDDRQRARGAVRRRAVAQGAAEARALAGGGFLRRAGPARAAQARHGPDGRQTFGGRAGVTPLRWTAGPARRSRS